MENIVILVPAATTFAKTSVDVLKMAFPNSPQWLSPVAAMVIGVLSVFLLMIAQGELITQQASAIAILAGILAGGGAVGVTELGRRSDTMREDARQDARI